MAKNDDNEKVFYQISEANLRAIMREEAAEAFREHFDPAKNPIIIEQRIHYDDHKFIGAVRTNVEVMQGRGLRAGLWAFMVICVVVLLVMLPGGISLVKRALG